MNARRWPASRVRSSSVTEINSAAAACPAPTRRPGSDARAAAPTAAYWSASRPRPWRSRATVRRPAAASGVQLLEQPGPSAPPAPGRPAAGRAVVEERPPGPGPHRTEPPPGARTGPAPPWSRQTRPPPASPCASPRRPPGHALGRGRPSNACAGMLEQVRPRGRSPPGSSSAEGSSSQRGSTANRLITSSAAAAFSSAPRSLHVRGLDHPACPARRRGRGLRRPRLGRRRRRAGNGWRARSRPRAAGTATTSRSG